MGAAWGWAGAQQAASFCNGRARWRAGHLASEHALVSAGRRLPETYPVADMVRESSMTLVRLKRPATAAEPGAAAAAPVVAVAGGERTISIRALAGGSFVVSVPLDATVAMLKAAIAVRMLYADSTRRAVRRFARKSAVFLWRSKSSYSVAAEWVVAVQCASAVWPVRDSAISDRG